MSKKDNKEVMVKAEDTATPTITVKTKKRGGCGTFLLGFVFAFILLIVLIGGTGVYMYYNMSIKTVENLIGVTIPLEGDIKNLVLKDLIAKKNLMVDASLDTLNTEFKLKLPETIPGTSLSLKETYDEEIEFLGKTKKVKEFRIQDIVNNLDKFVDAVLPKLYDHITIGQITETANTTILTDLGYPATEDEFYEVEVNGVKVKKKLSDLTINQALEVVPEYFKQENLTVQMALDAIGSDLLPYPKDETSKDVYAELRGLKIKDITVENVTDKITGEVLNRLVDLSDYDFLQTEEFNETKLNKIGDYFSTLKLGEFVNIDTVVTDSATYFAKPQYKNLQYQDATQETKKVLKMADVRSKILSLKVSEIFNDTDMLKIHYQYNNADNQTVQEFLEALPLNTIDFKTAITPPSGECVVDWKQYDGYVDILKDATAQTWTSTITSTDTKLVDLLGPDITAVGKICDLTIGEIKNSENAVKTILKKFGTLGDMISGEKTGIFAIIQSVSIDDLLSKPSQAITEKLKTAEDKYTLGTILGYTAGDSDNAIIKTVMGIKVSALFTDGNNAIISAIENDETLTLGALMKIGSEDKSFVSLLANVKLGDLLGTNAKSSIITALTKDNGADVTLGKFLNMDTSSASGVLTKMANISMASLIGDSATPGDAIQGVIDDLTLADVFGEYNDTMSTILKELYNMTPEGSSTTEKGQIKVNTIFENVNNIKLSKIITSDSNAAKFMGLIKDYENLTLGTISDMEVKENLTVGDLISAGIITNSTKAQSLKDKTLEELINNYPTTTE